MDAILWEPWLAAYHFLARDDLQIASREGRILILRSRVTLLVRTFNASTLPWSWAQRRTSSANRKVISFKPRNPQRARVQQENLD